MHMLPYSFQRTISCSKSGSVVCSKKGIPGYPSDQDRDCNYGGPKSAFQFGDTVGEGRTVVHTCAATHPM